MFAYHLLTDRWGVNTSVHKPLKKKKIKMARRENRNTETRQETTERRTKTVDYKTVIKLYNYNYSGCTIKVKNLH